MITSIGEENSGENMVVILTKELSLLSNVDVAFYIASRMAAIIYFFKSVLPRLVPLTWTSLQREVIASLLQQASH